MKKIIVALLIFSMLLSLILPIIANAEPDDAFLSSGEALEALGVLIGNKDGDLMLNNKLKRQDMVVLISRLYKEENSAKASLLKPTFTDIKNKYYEPYIKWSVDKGLIIGMNENTFGYNQNVTVKQFMAVLLRVLGYEEESKLWDTVPELAKNLGIMEGLNLNSNSTLTRGQMAVMTLNTLRLTIKGSTLTLAEKLNLKV
ncbi:S-layer homology domain-containing protein [Tissierella sp. Yu-01]|uniref:S-layer homology domain-containing protein n=1 Tax=Tissierella sp. Yu-01 TaxID=3035694 RepID=UPI00240DCF54|nr:S-layer homology domain-containing protein [Tissierella sp. Yu-01]WFA08668.1 S-layer homology domain-containing protein [Tissierella sp. Yu-01]